LTDWDVIRRIARERRSEVVSDPEALAHADRLIQTAMYRAGLWYVPVSAADPVLSGAFALLERSAAGILYSDALPPEKCRFILAHELAHWFLHDEPREEDRDAPADDPLTEPLPYSQGVVSGYSPAQRREVEANVFAAEFLLPCPALCAAFRRRRTVTEIAAQVGLSEKAVLNQMAEALLSPGGWSRTAPLSGAPDSEPAPSEPDTPPTLALDRSQREAAEVAEGPTLVTAGPGTGKTRTLVARILFLLRQGVPPERILALTFSNKATNEMRERLQAIVPNAARRLWIGTFHAFGLELLRRYWDRLDGVSVMPTLLTPLDAVTLLERNIARLNLREYEYLHNPAYAFPDILSAISRAKDELATPERYAQQAERMAREATDERSMREAAKALEVAHVYRVWQEILQENGLLDFGDLIARCVTLLREHEDIREEAQRQYPHILVDEYQDINRASAVLVKLLAGEGRGLWAVGDLRQAIYRFRGASAANVANFEQDYPNGKRMSLGVNYRSRETLVHLFNAAGTRMGAGTDAPDWRATRAGSGQNILIAEAESEEAQADGIARLIRRFRRDGFALRDQVILCRTNAQAEALALAMERRGVPTLFLGSLFDRPEVRDMLALLSLLYEGSPSSLMRAAVIPEYRASTEEVSAVLRHAQAEGVTPLEAITHFPALTGLSRLRRHLLAAHAPDAYAFLARYLFGEADYLRRQMDGRDVGSLRSRLALYQLLLLARSFASSELQNERRNDPDYSPHRAFLTYVRRMVSIGEDSRIRLPSSAEETEAVRLMTIHAAKGLEFPIVFLPNLSEGLFPARKPGAKVKLPPGLSDTDSGASDADSSEDECLFFVALTRARDHLILSRPKLAGGRLRNPSPLLAMVEEDLDSCGALRENWESRERADTEETSRAVPTADPAPAEPPMATKRAFTLAEVEQYMRCPRQFYYDRVLNLRGAAPQTPYGAMMRCVWSAIRWIQEEGRQGREVTPEEGQRYLERQWEEAEIPESAVLPLLRSVAEQIVTHACHVVSERRAGETQELEVELPEGCIRLTVDYVEEREDGTLLAERQYPRRPADDDHTSPQIALIREGLRQKRGRSAPVEISLRYLTTGETRPVREQPRWEPDRVAKYNAALQGIRYGSFPAQPSQEQCPHCPFFFLCPT
jgi:superfamily I DNA/RNA helicase/Zn-dependent peptidase ImmA (M78 family)